MEKEELKEKISGLRVEKQSFINDTYLRGELAREAVMGLPDSRFEFEVPKAGRKMKMKTVTRADGCKMKNRIVNQDIYNSAFVSIVAAIEDYLSKVMRCILKYDCARIKCTISGVNFIKDIPVVDIVDSDKESLLDYIIDQRIATLFYASPSKKLEYFDKALSIKIDDDTWEKWIEIKARSDLWIHNAVVVNQIYIDKTKNCGSFSLGEIAIISEDYFKEIVSVLKSMIGHIDSDIRILYVNIRK